MDSAAAVTAMHSKAPSGALFHKLRRKLKNRKTWTESALPRLSDARSQCKRIVLNLSTTWSTVLQILIRMIFEDLKIIYYPDPRLKKISVPVSSFDDRL